MKFPYKAYDEMVKAEAAEMIKQEPEPKTEKVVKKEESVFDEPPEDKQVDPEPDPEPEADPADPGEEV